MMRRTRKAGTDKSTRLSTSAHSTTTSKAKSQTSHTWMMLSSLLNEYCGSRARTQASLRFKASSNEQTRRKICADCPTHYIKGTNTFLVGTGASRILIDTSGGEPEYATLLHSVLKSRGISLKYVLVTHWHGDHSGGVPDIVRMYPHVRDDIYKHEPEAGQQDIVDGQVFDVEGARIIARHCPGHSSDHFCFLLDEENSMFTGDNILGHGTSAVEDLGLFMSSLRKMADMKCITGHPAHGSTIDDLPAKISRELASKVRRENQIMQTLKRLRDLGQGSVSVTDIVTGIYGNAVDENTRKLALEPFIEEALRKLSGDGRVGFAMRKGRKTWHAVPPVQRSKSSMMKVSQVAMKVQVHEIALTPE
ncbi:hypothetical protein LTR56_013047 [Elasticomyces elasticus]|nr:hypothetical protein LTR56_013047 [Elasticomyces elasticus]KAK4920503.1 hypothetical protein LTR49_011918 [Elasticomyces elasticus]KAK5758996.1 hypothetical protein LTS12_010937 [Elasticomyces elasticus]